MAPRRAATILHADLDAFYASVEQLLDPSLRRRPVAVGGGVVLAASYEARARGVRSGMPGWRARRLCPGLRFVGGHFGEYQRLGDLVIDILRDFTPLVERVSIDEAFLDVAGAVHLFGAPGDIAQAIRRRVRHEIGLPISVGVARTKSVAKVASQVAKPDGLVVVDPDRERSFLDPLPVDLIWGVGPVTGERLDERRHPHHRRSPRRAGDVLEHLLGTAAGGKLTSLAAAVDPRPVEVTRRAASIGAQAALGRRRPAPDLVRATLGYLVDRVAGRLRESRRAARTVTVRVRFTGLRSVTRSVTLAGGVSSTAALTELSMELVRVALAAKPGEPEITLLAVSLSNLVGERGLQLELPFSADDGRRHRATESASARLCVDRSVDAIRARYGRAAVGYASVAFGAAESVPDAFRELAERHAG